MGVKGGVGSGVRGNSNRIPDTKQPRLRVNRIIGVSRQDRAVSDLVVNPKSVAQYDQQHSEYHEAQPGDVAPFKDFFQIKAAEQKREDDLDLADGAHQGYLGDRETGEPAG
jgi:hypothetical protein